MYEAKYDKGIFNPKDMFGILKNWGYDEYNSLGFSESKNDSLMIKK